MDDESVLPTVTAPSQTKNKCTSGGNLGAASSLSATALANEIVVNVMSLPRQLVPFCPAQAHYLDDTGCTHTRTSTHTHAHAKRPSTYLDDFHVFCGWIEAFFEESELVESVACRRSSIVAKGEREEGTE